MKYFRVITHYNPYFEEFASTLAFFYLEKYESEDELINDIKSFLENDGVAYVQYQEITYNIFNRAEVKTMNDYSFGNYNQKLYTKFEKYVRNNEYVTTYVV